MEEMVSIVGEESGESNEEVMAGVYGVSFFMISLDHNGFKHLISHDSVLPLMLPLVSVTQQPTVS